MKKTTRQAQRKHYQHRYSLQHYLAQHRQAFSLSWQRLKKMPGISLLTVIVVTVVLSLPLLAWVGLQNLNQFSEAWSGQAQISVFLQPKTSNADAKKLIQQLRLRHDVASVRYVSPDDGLRELSQQSGLESVLSQLNTNPLPGVILVQPVTTLSDATAKPESLLNALKQLPGVALTQDDTQWLQRFFGFLSLAREIVAALAGILLLAVLFVVNHSVRMIIDHYRQEITVMKLVGATSRFIARPFLYLGILYAVLGAMCAWILAGSVLTWLSGNVQRLADLYQSEFVLQGVGFMSGCLLVLGMALLGLFAAWFAVRRQYRLAVGTSYF